MLSKGSARTICASTMLTLATSFPITASAQAVLEGAGETSTLDCAGGDAVVTGSENKVTVEGACKKLTVEGSGNVVVAQMRDQSSISVIGTGNRVSWRTLGKTAPRVSSTGVGNSISRAR